MSDLTVDDFFRGKEDSRKLFDAISREVDHLGDATVQVSKSQVAFRRRKSFALVWIPGQYLSNRRTAPLVLTLSFPTRDASPRWKEITEAGANRFTHHLELYRKEDVDDDVRRWLRATWEQAA